MVESYFNIENYFSKQHIGLATVKLTYNNEKKPVDLIFTEVNESFEKVLGINKETIIGKKYSDIHCGIHEEIVNLYTRAENNNSKKTLKYYDRINKKHFIVSLYPDEKDQLSLMLQDISEIINLEKKNHRINRIINASGLINKLILNEKELSVLLQKSSEVIAQLVKAPIVWIVLLNREYTSVTDFYSSNNIFSKLLVGNYLTPCIKDILLIQKSGLYKSSLNHCTNCNEKCSQEDTSHLLIPLKFNDIIYGVLNITFDSTWECEKNEIQYFEDIAADLAYSCFNTEIKKELEQARKKVRTYYSEIADQNKRLLKLNKELRLKNEQLEITKEKALESEQLKSAFLSNISHELRTPLNGMLGFIQLIKQPNHSLENIKEYLEIIHQSGHNLLDAINSILDISRIECNQMPVNFQECKVKSIISDTVMNIKTGVLDQKKIKLLTDTTELSDDFSFLCDEYKLRQILEILIKNAIKFTKKGEVSIGAHIKEENILFFVKDTGIGIDKKKFKSIFENFTQADDTTTREFEGIGLGLPIAKGLVNILNGEIWLDSEVGRGTTFYVKIPYAINKCKTENEMDFSKINNLDWSAKKILIVEDDIFSAEYLAEALGITNVNILFANNGNQAIKVVKENPDIDLILMDIQLPGLSGDKATSIIRESNNDIPIIAQTAHAMVNDRENYINAGCTDYIAKPSSVSELFTVISKYIVLGNFELVNNNYGL